MPLTRSWIADYLAATLIADVHQHLTFVICATGCLFQLLLEVHNVRPGLQPIGDLHVRQLRKISLFRLLVRSEQRDSQKQQSKCSHQFSLPFYAKIKHGTKEVALNRPARPTNL